MMLIAAPLYARAEPATLVVPTLSGAVFDLNALRGHPVIVNFWATWCVPCRTEMPVLSAFYQHHHGEGLEMIGLSVDNPRDYPNVEKLAASLAYPIAIVKKATANSFPTSNALPVTYVIDAKGEITKQLSVDQDGLTEAKLAALVGPLLSRP